MINIFFILKSIFSTNQGCNLSKNVPYFTFQLEMIIVISYDFQEHLPDEIENVKSESFEVFNKDHKNVFTFSCIQVKHKKYSNRQNCYDLEFKVNEFLIMPVFTSNMYGIISFNVYENDFYVYKVFFIVENINNLTEGRYPFSITIFLRRVIYDNFIKPLEENIEGFTDSLTDFIDYLNQKDSKYLENFYEGYPLLSKITFDDLKSNLNYILTLSKEIKNKFKGIQCYNSNMKDNLYYKIYKFFFLQKDIQKNYNDINPDEPCFLLKLQDMINLFNHHRNKKIKENSEIIKWEIWDILTGDNIPLKIKIKKFIFLN